MKYFEPHKLGSLVSKNQLRKIQGVSFPRSGHHLLVNCLLAYFSENPFFIQTSGNLSSMELLGAWNFNFCDYYSHCNQSPCPNPATSFQKNHDYEYTLDMRELLSTDDPDVRSTLKPIPGSPLEGLRSNPHTFWLIQNRRMLPALVSYYKLSVAKGFYMRWDKEKKVFVRTDDTDQAWRRFALDNRSYWKRFYQRWIVSPPENSLLLWYEDLIQNPFESLKRCIDFFDPQGEINESYLKEVIEVQNISPKDDYLKFKYYDRGFFEELEKA